MRRTIAALLAFLVLATLPGLADSVVATQEYKAARVLVSGGRWAEALVHLDKALKVEQDYPDALYMAALCHLALDQFDLAGQRLTRLTQLRPDFFPAWGQLAQMYVRQKNFDKARETLGALGKVKGGMPESLYGFGVLAWVEGKLDVAEKEWQEALRLKPDMAKAHHNLGILYREKGDRARALSALQDAVRLDSDNPLYRFSLGFLQMETGAKADGMGNLDRARSQTERRDLGLLALAAQMLLNGHPEQADKAAAQALLANPDLTMALVIRARALEALKRPDEARAVYEKILLDDPNLSEARKALERIPAPAPVASPAPSPAPSASPSPQIAPPGPAPSPSMSPSPQVAPPSPAPSPAP